MGIVEDALGILDRIPIWKRLKQVPSEVDEIKERIVALEDKLNGKWPPDVCRFCGMRAARLDNSFPANEKGIVNERWLCAECKQMDFRSHKA